MGGTWEGVIPLKALSPSAGASDIGDDGQVRVQVCTPTSWHTHTDTAEDATLWDLGGFD